MPISEIAEKRVAKVEDAIEVGQTLDVMVTEIRPDERRMLVSLRRVARDAERKRVKEFLRGQEDEGRITIGDAVGALLRQVVEPRTEEPQPAPVAESKPEPGQ
jgi:ribosomal protein S1